MTMHARIEALDEGLERRRTRREPLRLPVQGAMPDHTKVDALIEDMSLTGVLMQTEAELPADARVALELPEIGRAHATVVWGTGRYYGARFDSPLEPAVLSAARLKGSFGAENAMQIAVPDVQFADASMPAAGSRKGLPLPIMGGLALAAWAAIIVPIFFI